MTEPVAELRVRASNPPYQITVVCLGNICRSPIAEAVLRARIAGAGMSHLVAVDSAGTGDWHLGHDADPRARAVLRRHGYTLSHQARQIDRNKLTSVDLLLAMDASNYADLQRMLTTITSAATLAMLRSFDPELSGLEPTDARLNVPDPYYGDDADFVAVLRMIEAAADGLLTQLPAFVQQRT